MKKPRLTPEVGSEGQEERKEKRKESEDNAFSRGRKLTKDSYGHYEPGLSSSFLAGPKPKA